MSGGPFPLPIVYNSCPIGMNFFEPATPLSGGIWDSTKWDFTSNVTFVSDGVHINGSSGFQPNGGVNKLFNSVMNPVGTFIYARASFSYTANSNPDMNLGAGDSNAFINLTGVTVSQFSHKVQLYFGGGPVYTGALILTNPSGPYIMEYTYEVVATDSAKMTYYLWDATQTTLLENGSYTIPNSIQNTLFVGFYQKDAYASTKLLDLWVYGPSISGAPCVGTVIAPTLVSPANASTNISSIPTLVLTDNNSPSDSFDYQMSNDGAFSGGDIFYQALNVVSTSLLLNILLSENTEYWWRARATVGSNHSGWASPFHFTTSTFSLLSPANHSTVNRPDPFLTWSKLTGATTYNIQVSVNSDMSAPVININRPAMFLGYHIPSPLIAGTKYYWRVQPMIGIVAEPWSSIWDFTIAIPVLQADFEGPNIMMRYSIDRGKTWSDEDWQQMGEPGSYAGRNRWVGLGSGYGICFWFRSVGDTYTSWRSVRVRAQ